MKIWPEKELPHQTIGFEMPAWLGEPFRLVVPELVSDAEAELLPWSEPSPPWTIAEDRARCRIAIDAVIDMAADIRFQPERIEVVVTVTTVHILKGGIEEFAQRCNQ